MHENSHKWNIKLGIRRTLLNLQIICYIFLLNWYQDDVWNKNKNIICNFPLWPKEKWLFYLALSDSISSLWSTFRQQTWETDGGKLCYGDNITLYYIHFIGRNIIHSNHSSSNNIKRAKRYKINTLLDNGRNGLELISFN